MTISWLRDLLVHHPPLFRLSVANTKAFPTYMQRSIFSSCTQWPDCNPRGTSIPPPLTIRLGKRAILAEAHYHGTFYVPSPCHSRCLFASFFLIYLRSRFLEKDWRIFWTNGLILVRAYLDCLLSSFIIYVFIKIIHKLESDFIIVCSFEIAIFAKGALNLKTLRTSLRER